MRRLNPDTLVRLNRPFAVFVEPGDVGEDGAVEWFAKIVGYELDNMTLGEDPIDAVDSVIDVLRLLAGVCPNGVHNWIIDHGDRWECGKCGELARKEAIIDE